MNDRSRAESNRPEDEFNAEMESETPRAEDTPEDANGEPLASDDAQSETDGEQSREETRDEEMERLRKTAAEADKRVLMAQAEAENFRKRMRRDYEEQSKYAALPLVSDLLSVRDNLLRALEAAGDNSEIKGLKEGVAMVAKQLDDTFAKYAVREIPAEGELFDPNYHEAISQMPSDQPAGTVAHVAQPGFQMHERVVRPSQVVVSTGPAQQ